MFHSKKQALCVSLTLEDENIVKVWEHDVQPHITDPPCLQLILKTWNKFLDPVAILIKKIMLSSQILPALSPSYRCYRYMYLTK